MTYFEQKLNVDTSNSTLDRFQYFTDICRNKNVLHVGFVDWPITDPKQNMHLMIDKVCSSLIGVDPNYQTYDSVKDLLINKETYGAIEDIANIHFDIVIVPEVIEHVGNVESFLKELETLSFDTIYISAPNVFDLLQNGRMNKTTGVWTETVHPDHNCWYSPYTLNNVITKYTNLKNKSIIKLKWGSIVGVYER